MLAEHFVVIIMGGINLHCHGEDVISARMLTQLPREHQLAEHAKILV